MILSILIAAAALPRELTAIERTHISSAVGEKLKDEKSARFKWLPWDKSVHYCGYVNAKNSYGAYGGFIPFFALVDNRRARVGTFVYVQLADANPNSPSTATVLQLCYEAGYELN